MVRSMMSQTTLPKSFWDYGLETDIRILNMVPTKKVDKTPYKVWHGKNSLIDQEASGSIEDLEIIQEEDTHPSLDTSLNHEEEDLEINEPQSDIVPVRSIPMLQSVKTYLRKCFAMKDLGEAAYILGIKIYRDRSKRLIGLCESAHIKKILKRYCMENSKRGSIPMQEKLTLSKSQGASTPAEMKRMQNVPYASANPGDIHWTTVKNILKYRRNTKDMFLVYGGDLKRELRVPCYTDAGYLMDADDLKSHTGYVFVLNGG
nr:hypothetical protein [Tanacetum cinerariifolium]